jgi:ElaB/YqjD/DUF883 family membrane-anchored ribosome-binding protein
MATEPEVTKAHEDIDQTRSDLAQKVEQLEEKVRDTVLSATENVNDTIESVTSTVQQTVHSVQQTFDVNYQMQQRPWLLIGGAVVVGFVVGAAVSRQRSGMGWGRSGRPADFSPSAESPQAPAERFAPQPESRGPSLVSNLLTQFGPEINKVKEVAIGYLVGMARDAIKDALPALGSQIEEVMNSATTKLGGEPVRGSVLHEGSSSPGQRHDL